MQPRSEGLGVAEGSKIMFHGKPVRCRLKYPTLSVEDRCLAPFHENEFTTGLIQGKQQTAAQIFAAQSCRTDTHYNLR